MRTSDRVFLDIPITISGTDSEGREFVENTRSLVLSRRGARIESKHVLVPEQQLKLRCLKTELETEVRVVGAIMAKDGTCHYGVALLAPEVNIWGINFPLLDGTENPAGRMYLACGNCNAQEVVHLDVFELEVFLANSCITRLCAWCDDPTTWRRAMAPETPPTADKASHQPRHAIQERKWPRINLKVIVCLHHPAQGQDVVTTENISRGGFRTRSKKNYPIGAVLEAAVPYTPGAANIFTPVRVVHKELAVGADSYVYRFAYVPSPNASSLTGLRITRPK